MQEVCEDTHLAGTTGRSAQCVTLTRTVCWKFLRATTSITDFLNDLPVRCHSGGSCYHLCSQLSANRRQSL